jgi:Uma2 family endonuclease
MALAVRPARWTLEQKHRLPDDGNKYELVRGQLFVTPPPTNAHETISAILNALLAPFVADNELGLVYRPKAVVRFEGSEVEPDLFVRQRHPSQRGDDTDWDTAPTPILVVEILSPVTRRRDLLAKRQLYLDAGVAEYWIIDPDDRSITVVRPGMADEITVDQLRWRPAGATVPLTLDVNRLFGDVDRARLN